MDLIDGLSHGMVETLGNNYDASTRKYGRYRIQLNTLNNGEPQASLVLNNLSCVFVKTYPYFPITLKEGAALGAIGWGETKDPCGQYNYIEDDILKARYYSGGLNYVVKVSNEYLVKDANPAYFLDTESTSGAFAHLVDATVEEYETVFKALVDLVAKINECWENM